MTKELTRLSRRLIFVTTVPFLLGLVIALALQNTIVPNPILVGQIVVDVGTLVLLLGLTISSAAWIGTLVFWYWLRRHRRVRADERHRQDENHRRFVRRLDHEMKNPLATVQVSLVNLKQLAYTNGQDGLALRAAEEQVARLRRLIQNLRKLADLETYPLERELVNLAELLPEAISAVQHTLGRTERPVPVIAPQVPWSPMPITGDRDVLMLAFYNLIENAFKFTRADDSIEIRVYEDGTTVTVDVADSGPGIAEADLPHIFEELYRGESVGQVEGSGLGLALVRKIVERHGGQIIVRSRVGQGTVFTVRLPPLPEKQ